AAVHIQTRVANARAAQAHVAGGGTAHPVAGVLDADTVATDLPSRAIDQLAQIHALTVEAALPGAADRSAAQVRDAETHGRPRVRAAPLPLAAGKLPGPAGRAALAVDAPSAARAKVPARVF